MGVNFATYKTMVFKLALVNTDDGWQLHKAKRQLPDIVYHL
jgi:hypothetical protein